MLIAPTELLEQTANELNTCTASMVGSQHEESNAIIRLEKWYSWEGEDPTAFKNDETKAEHACGYSSRRLRNGQTGNPGQVQ